MKRKYLYLSGLMIAIGLLFGVNYEKISNQAMLSIDKVTSLFSENSNATDSNATDSNATNSNATNSNATDSNLEGDVTVNSDGNLFFNKFDIQLSSFQGAPTNGSEILVDIDYTGAELTGGTIQLTKQDTSEQYIAELVRYCYGDSEDEIIGYSYYIRIPNNIPTGFYNLTKYEFNAMNSDGTTFIKTYENDQLQFVPELISGFTISNLSDITINISNIKLNTTEVKNGDKVYVTYNVDKEISNVELFFEQESQAGTSTYIATLHDVGTKPYFVVPSDWAPAKYYLTGINAWNEEGVGFTNAPPLDLYINVTKTADTSSENNKKEELYYQNETINDNVLKDIYQSEKDSIITINANKSRNISSDIFNVIKGTDRKLIIEIDGNQIIFNGKDITKVKAINASMSTNLVSEDKIIKSLIKDGVVINFADNGELPGKATIKLKATKEMTESFKNNSVNLYFFQEEKKKFNLITESISLNNDNYYVFEINHNSKYVMTKDKISSKLVEVANTAAFQKKNSSYISIILIVLIVALSIVCYTTFSKEEEIEVI